MSIDPEFAMRLLVGNLSYLLLIISMTMTRIVPLRMVAIGSGVAGQLRFLLVGRSCWDILGDNIHLGEHHSGHVDCLSIRGDQIHK